MFDPKGLSPIPQKNQKMLFYFLFVRSSSSPKKFVCHME